MGRRSGWLKFDDLLSVNGRSKGCLCETAVHIFDLQRKSDTAWGGLAPTTAITVSTRVLKYPVHFLEEHFLREADSGKVPRGWATSEQAEKKKG